MVSLLNPQRPETNTLFNNPDIQWNRFNNIWHRKDFHGFFLAQRVFCLPTRLLPSFVSCSCIYISRGSVAIQSRCRCRFYNTFIGNCLQNTLAKKFWKSLADDLAKIWTIKKWDVFWDTVYILLSAVHLFVNVISCHSCKYVYWSTVILVSLQDINMRKPFRSSIIKEQQVITKTTRPQSVMLMYQHYCEPAPALEILNPYRFVTCIFSPKCVYTAVLLVAVESMPVVLSTVIVLSPRVITVYWLYRVRQKILPPWGFLIIFSKWLRIFKQNFTRLLFIQIYAKLQIFFQLSPTLTKLCRIKRDHPPNFYISQHVHHEFY